MRSVLTLSMCCFFLVISVCGLNVYTKIKNVKILLASPVESVEDIQVLNTQWKESINSKNELVIKSYWDADLNYHLGLKAADLARYETNLGIRDNLYTESINFYLSALSFRPVFSLAILEYVKVLIEQGAPLEFILPLLDHVLNLSLKENDIRARFALICFQLLSTQLSHQGRNIIISRLKKIYKYSIDYRGQSNIDAYARLYSQQALLKQIKLEVNNK